MALEHYGTIQVTLIKLNSQWVVNNNIVATICIFWHQL